VAVVTCPKCPTALRIPDGVSGNVKCPNCRTDFLVAAPVVPTANYVPPLPPEPVVAAARNILALPPEPGSTTPTAMESAPAKAAPRAPEKLDSERVNEPKPKKKVKATIEDDEDEDEPRRRKNRNEDDEDDDYRSRKKKKPQRYEEDEDDYRPPTPRDKKGYGKARVGVLLLTISSWLYFSLYALLTLGVFILLIGTLFESDSPGSRSSSYSSRNTSDIASLVEAIMVLFGLMGLGNWIVSLVGFAFCIAGPPRTRATAITTTSLAGVHLILVVLSYSFTSNMLGGFRLAFSGGTTSSWFIFATTVPYLDTFLPALVYQSRAINGEYIVLILTGAFEVVRLIFMLLTIKGMAVEGKNYVAAERAQLGVLAASIIVGGGMILMLFIVLLLNEAKFSSIKTIASVGLGAFFLLCLAYTAMLLIPATTAGGTQRSLAQRNR
jgi:hypothetical protein